MAKDAEETPGPLPSPAAVAVRGLVKSFHPHKVLRGVDLDVAVGERVALTGDNGSGKTTLLRILATLMRADAGTVHVAGADVRRDAQAVRARVALVAQDPPYFDELSVAEHIGWARSLDRRSVRRPGPDAVDSVLGRWDLRALRKQSPQRLSRGQRQRLALAMAFGREPDVLLLDEPTTALDESGQAILRSELEVRRGATLAAIHGARPGAFDASYHLQHGRLVRGVGP